MSKKPIVIHEGNAYNRDMIAMTMPLFIMAFFFYGPRVLLMAGMAVITAKLTDRVGALLRGRVYDKTENSSVTIALIIVLIMPATVRYRVVIGAVAVAIMVGKEAFGGFQNYPFNPVAVGFCVAAVSWPKEMFRYPQPSLWMIDRNLGWSEMLKIWRFEDQTLLAGPSAVLRNGAMPSIDTWNLLLGQYAGPLGATSVVVILACAVFLIVKKRLPLAAPVAFVFTAAVIAYVFPRYAGVHWATSMPWQQVALRLEVVKYEILSGVFVFAAVFMVNEPGTLPKNTVSRLIYGSLMGFMSMMFRYYGTFELGICFSFLLVNAVSGYFDRAVARSSAKRKGAAHL